MEEVEILILIGSVGCCEAVGQYSVSLQLHRQDMHVLHNKGYKINKESFKAIQKHENCLI